MKFGVKKYLILFVAVLAFQNLECSSEDDLGWNPIKNNSPLYAMFLENVAHGLDEARQAYEQGLRLDSAQASNQDERLLLDVSSPTTTFESGVTTHNSRSSSDLSDRDDQYDPLALIFGCDQLVAQKVKKVKTKKKKSNASIDPAACAVAQQVKSLKMMQEEAEQARREAQRRQSIAKREAEFACERAGIEAKLIAREQQRLRQIELSKNKKTLNAAAQPYSKSVKDSDLEYLDGLIRAENERKEALAEKVRQAQLAEEVSRVAYEQKKSDIVGMSSHHEVLMLNQSMQDVLTFIESLKLSNSDMETIQTAFHAEKNLRYDMLLRGQGASFEDDGSYATYTCTNFYVDADFFIEAFKALELMIGVDLLLFVESSKMKKNKKTSVKNFVINMFEKYIHRELTITPKMYDLFYDVYQAEYDFIKMVEDEGMSVYAENLGLRKMEALLDLMEKMLRKSKQW